MAYKLVTVYRRPKPVEFTTVTEPVLFSSISKAANYALHKLRHSNFQIIEVDHDSSSEDWNEFDLTV